MEIDLRILQCPLTSETLRWATPSELDLAVLQENLIPELITSGLVNASATFFFPCWRSILCLHAAYALPLKQEAKAIGKMEFDKERIFNYFNDINFHEFENQQIYDDATDFVDFRPFMLPYTQHGFYNCRNYLDKSGKYYADIACGPVAFREYVMLAEGFDCRICVDVSINALLQAQQNLALHKQPAIFICGDITALPLQPGIADAVLCQHALFHVPKKMQATALKELVRIAASGKKVAIVYDWFYHSLFMNLALGPYQVYRVVRHLAGKIYSRLFRKNNLYFYSHSLAWFKKYNPGKSLSVYAWRSINIHFSKFYLHERLGGKKWLKRIWEWEEKHPEKMGKWGEYPIIVIEK